MNHRLSSSSTNSLSIGLSRIHSTGAIWVQRAPRRSKSPPMVAARTFLLRSAIPRICFAFGRPSASPCSVSVVALTKAMPVPLPCSQTPLEGSAQVPTRTAGSTGKSAESWPAKDWRYTRLTFVAGEIRRRSLHSRYGG
jgi:hypothetical protein